MNGPKRVVHFRPPGALQAPGIDNAIIPSQKLREFATSVFLKTREPRGFGALGFQPVAMTVDGKTINSDTLGLHLGAKALELWVAAAWKSFGPCARFSLPALLGPVVTNSALASVAYLHSRLYGGPTRELARRTGLATSVRRGRRGRPP